ncbi:FAD-linked oxidase [Wenjunlia vitaminophila]|uniref:FAD-linked oxidase n=1 Tax=Wenjunlia vitaminophila TaxID=76728 RepID=A0A0T6LRA4_WENVI|nr:FAD-binding protein [Wenjunlia vitaminophila]KRV48654.1 FAD-linked oxidase [Wenjunlia vitaminophila]
MADHTRRHVLRGTAAVTAAGLAVGGARSTADAATAAGGPAEGAGAAGPGPVVVRPGDPRYPSLVDRHYNLRFQGSPEAVHVVTSTRDVVRAVQDAVRSGRRLAVRSGGHCFEDFVEDPRVRVMIDMSAMDEVSYDAERRAFVVGAGSTLGEAYRRLFLGWGVTVPAGWCPDVGVGGHVPGGGYGPLCRMYGLSVDHLYAVEVVVVDGSGVARPVVATREPDDPNRELWWAHTGGGGGNFGVATRFWFRSPGARGTDPAGLLPAPPEEVLNFAVHWPWEQLDLPTFTRLLDNHGAWVERNSAAGVPEAGFYSEFVLSHRSMGSVMMIGQVAGGGGAARRVLDSHLSALDEGLGLSSTRRVTRMSWLSSALLGPPEEAGLRYCLKVKSSYRRRALTHRDIGTIHRYLTRDAGLTSGMVSLNTYGSRVNAVAPGATVVAQRDAVLKVMYLTAWQQTDDDERHLAWLRGLYRDTHPDSGGVPVPDGVLDGAFVNYPDRDLADPRWNTSGVPWYELYYKGSAPRLRAAKRRWDPLNVFRHALSIPPA